MNRFEQTNEILREFYQIEPDNIENGIFIVLKKLINFKSGYIFFSNSKKYEYAFKPKVSQISQIKDNYICENLFFKKAQFGQIVITGEKFTDIDKKIFKTCSIIISNIIRDFEVSKVIKIQLKALQDGYLEIQQKNKKIKASEQIKTKFISHISHEFRTPINSILGYSELLGEEFAGSLTPKQKEFVNDIKISSLHLLGMVNEILDISKIDSGTIKLNLSEFSIKNGIQEVLNIVKPLLIQKQQELKTEIPDLIIKADYQKFQQILFNLLSNAIKYTQENGTIKIHCLKENNSIKISVTDNGIGIAKKDLKKIFRRFEQIGETKQNSTGLGLSITKELVNMHNGNINVTSTPQKGTIFTVEFPQ